MDGDRARGPHDDSAAALGRSSCAPLGDRAIPASGVHPSTTASPPAGDDRLLEASRPTTTPSLDRTTSAPA